MPDGKIFARERDKERKFHRSDDIPIQRLERVKELQNRSFVRKVDKRDGGSLLKIQLKNRQFSLVFHNE